MAWSLFMSVLTDITLGKKIIKKKKKRNEGEDKLKGMIRI